MFLADFYPTCAHFIVMVRAFFAESDTRISSKNSSLLIVQGQILFFFPLEIVFSMSNLGTSPCGVTTVKMATTPIAAPVDYLLNMCNRAVQNLKNYL